MVDINSLLTPPYSEGACSSGGGEVCVYKDPAGRFTIRPYQAGDELRILDLFRRVFGVERSCEHWRWKFRDNPAGSYVLRVAETQDGRLVGQYALLPVRTRWGHETVTFIQVIDVMVDPHYRMGLKRPGLFSVLAEQSVMAFLRGGLALIGYGFPTPEALRIGARAVGYHPLHPIQRLVKDLTVASRPRSFRPWSVRCERVARFGDNVEMLWRRCASSFDIAVIRDAEYLNWRYADCPDVAYTMVAAGQPWSGILSGAAVLRMGWADQPIACLADWLVPPDATSTAERLLAHCEALAREAGMERLSAWFPQHAWPYRFLCEHGYRVEPTIYHLVALATDPMADLERVRDRWYYTMGDSDIF
ncbi:MAG: GNAT family N-acetyltransferase [Candidatus Methylomirabilis oxygeniifera]|nr:MAG: GNAT family N-acetyltransferase [Candidatus Methylomirabilis oxyfera]